MLISKEEKFDFDDILLTPEIYSDIESRYKDINPYYNILKLPLLTAPMDTVVDKNNVNIFINNGIGVVLPRTIKNITLEELLYYNVNKVFVSYGLNEFESLLDDNINTTGWIPMYVCCDIANGHLSKIVDLCKKAKNIKPDITIMVGNIANPETYRYYAENDCVDYIRVGIGGGNACSTSVNTGCGYALASLIHETYKVKQDFIFSNNIDIKHQNSILHTKPVRKIPLIVADGGMKNYSDVIKALGVGCFLPNSLVNCGNKYKKIQNIKIDDYVITHKLRRRKVNNLLSYKYSGEIIQINNNYSTPTHEYYAIDKKYKNIVKENNIHEYAEWISANKLTNNYLLINNDIHQHRMQMLLGKFFNSIYIYTLKIRKRIISLKK